MTAADITRDPWTNGDCDEGPLPERTAAVTVARLAMAAYLRQLHAEATEPEILMNRAVNHADWMTTASAKAGDVVLADAYAGVTATLSRSRERMYARRPMRPSSQAGLASLIPSGGAVTAPTPAPSDDTRPPRILGFNVVTITPEGDPGAPRLDGVVSRQRAQDELDELEPFMKDGWTTVMVELREVKP